ncbi:toprim domain-containing protein [Gaoshiqia sp. Z1-71]|uniref:toprim domain-containing protein n=1 Tax=Gaoshiqia hydrogeniformans TaxID=3290090 RepID=UPI003BF87C33
MTCTEANKIPCTHILTHHYNQTGEVRRNDVWFKAPNRNESRPSLKVNRTDNVWYDFGSGKGGRPVDLVCYLSGVSVAGALLVLSGIAPAPIDFFSFDEQNSATSSIEIKHLQPLQNKALIQYVESRNISAKVAGKYLEEAYYLTNEKNYFALAFKNDKGGFELRNKYFKGGSSPKAITTIPGVTKSVNLFEGFMDFLSAVEYFSSTHAKNHTIVLNSLSNINDRFLADLSKFIRINLYLDNDQAGQRAAQIISQLYPSTINHAEMIYQNYKDFNELLTNKNEDHVYKNAKSSM